MWWKDWKTNNFGQKNRANARQEKLLDPCEVHHVVPFAKAERLSSTESKPQKKIPKSVLLVLTFCQGKCI